ncbi:MAG: T9SS type A sorting domain-containing protein [Cyclobacteriaceae bacterium]|nr:T9SS type A sorting domain-containing protein [Cyclobacteriaceae bacterium]
MRTTGLVGFLFLSVAAVGQFNYTIEQGIPVEENGNVLTMPWAGGINAAQFNTMDLNGDSKDDLVVFDRTSNKLFTFININNQYQYAPHYESLFPALTHWLLLRDLNCDGKKDLFTSDPFGMVAYVNTTKPGQLLSWRPYDPGRPILTKGFTSNVNLQLNASDIPVIDDIDGDGDLDILNVRFVGIGTIEYHKNLSMERTGTCDSLQLERITQTFGNLEECQCNFAFGGEPCPTSGGRTQHAGGKAMLTLDTDNDGDKDLLFSEETCTALSFLENKGTNETANMNSFTTFPASNPINFMIFPAAFYEDVDFDGKPDLIASPNVYARTFTSAINFKESAWFYKNTGTTALPQFTLQQKNFLQANMIDVGDYAVPAFFDADGDGDLDLFISNYADVAFASRIRFYENTGTPSEPAFTLRSEDFGGFSSSPLFNLKIQFADLNADGRPDLVFTGTNMFNGQTNLAFLPNKATTGLNISGQTVQAVSVSIGQQENILIYDLDQDGKPDMFIGKANGAIQYWRNTGSTQPAFTLTNASYLGFGATTDRQNPTLAIGDLNADGRADLIVGNQRGELSIYSDIRAQNPVVGLTQIIYNPLTETSESRNLGARVWPAITNLTNSDMPAIVCGTLTGGLLYLKNTESTGLPPVPVINLYPNPVGRNATLTLETDRDMTVEFFSMIGQRISVPHFVPANQPFQVAVSGMAAGIYLARFSWQGKTVARRFVIN